MAQLTMQPRTSMTQPAPAGWRLELLFTLFGLTGLALVLLFYDRAFPSAAIDLDLSRDEISRQARVFLQSQGHDLTGYDQALSFNEDWWASVYLQRFLGVAATNELIRREQLPVWTWQVRWFRPLHKEEFSVSLTPAGEVISFSHSLPEEAPGAALGQEEARRLATDYLAGDYNLADWELATASSTTRPGGRVDFYFEWKNREFSAGEADLRLSATIQGDRVGGSNFWLRTPEEFQRRFLEQRNLAGFFNNLSYGLGVFGFGLLGLLAYLIAVWRGSLAWHAGLGPALLVAGVAFLAGLNTLPLNKAWYPTTQDYTLFWLERLLYVAFTTGLAAGGVFVLWGGGRYLAKLIWPRRDKILPRRHTRQIIARSAWRGLMAGGMMGGYVILFYLAVTYWFGGWTPMYTPYTDLYATPLPFLGPLQSGLLPAMSEELIFRLVGVSLVLWLFSRRWLALLVPGVLWAFAHLTYVRDPFYLRGIELMVVAVFLGLLFIRFDLLTVIIAHFTYNAGLSALPLLRSDEPYFVASGLVVVGVMLAPVLPGAIGAIQDRLRGGRQLLAQPQLRPLAAGDLPLLETLPVEGISWEAVLSSPQTAALGLQAGNGIAGVAVGRMTTEGNGEVLVVYIAPEWRRQYWGSALAEALAVQLQAQGAERVVVTARAGDRKCSLFWAGQGWQPAIKTFTWSPAFSSRPAWRELAEQARRMLKHRQFT